ncbi:MAG: hypothetical protein QOF57_116 [Frankiaceae bacterium]|nr:hypothetical protein [Frankiaceae bacterium]
MGIGLDRALWRAVAAYRLLSLGYAAVLLVHNRGTYHHPVVAWAVLAGMVGWTAAAIALYPRDARRPPAWLLGLDLAMAVAGILLTRVAVPDVRITAGGPTLPVSWAASPVLAWAVARGPVLGAGAGLAVGAADVIERGSAPSQATVNAIVLLFLVGAVVGYVVQLARDAQARLARAVELEAATRERDRLARRIHDGVLQVLALVARRGTEIGGPAAELGRQAAEQELALRALVAAAPPDKTVAGSIDLRSLLMPHASRAVTVSAPADPVLLPTLTAHELADAVAAALDNVVRHAGPDAHAWVLVEDEGANVVVSVRDDGAGMPPERLDEAAAAGRLGVAQSIRGRVEAIGGRVHVSSSPEHGTEVELQVPRRESA